MPTADYGDRQDRARMLIEHYRARGEIIYVCTGRAMTGEGVANEIESGTLFGRSLVAVYGLVLQAKASTPNLFNKAGDDTYVA